MPEVPKTMRASSSSTAIVEKERPLLDELDALVIEHLEKAGDYIRCALDEERLMKQGYINIAHSRMCMKPYQLTLDGFLDSNEDIEPSTTVECKKTTEADDVSQERVLVHDGSSDAKLRSTFGKLIPSSMKQAQSSFLKVIERQVERSNISARLMEIEERIAELQKKVDVSRQEDPDYMKSMKSLSLE